MMFQYVPIGDLRALECDQNDLEYYRNSLRNSSVLKSVFVF